MSNYMERLEELRANVYEMYRDIHGFKPRHINWDSLSRETLLDMRDELIEMYDSDWYKQQIEDDKQEIAHMDLMDKYDDEDEAMKAEPHPDDFYDTMDFGKDKAKLRDFNPHLESLIRELVSNVMAEQLNRNQHSLDLEEQYLQRQKQLLQEIKSLTREFVKIQNMNFNKLHSSELNELAWEIEEVFKKELGKMFRDA